ncbi:hypothetical protein [Amphibacillus cookii]|uniref:hypothetical protein n=1 Tax=Amphibacillus cookii TaxID=767787 RepID=UPI001957923C|nr:hypothetical protein [Amphibacillus cookii]MBM7540028.1 hypothetical protein [Amphibacillus cookii]
MIVTIGTKQKTFENHIESVTPLIKWIEEVVNESDKHFSHLLIDDQEVHEQFDLVISDKITEIEKIEVVLKTESELLNELYLSGEAYLIRALPEIEKLTEKFYQTPDQEAWGGLEQLIEGITWLDQLYEAIDQARKQPLNWDKFTFIYTKLRMELVNLEDAIKMRDQTLIADIINYEVMPIMEELKLVFTACIDQEGERKDVN